MQIADAEAFLLQERRFSSAEKRGIEILYRLLKHEFRHFDSYPGVLGGGVRVIAFGTFTEGSGANRPAFGIFQQRDTCSFGLRFDARDLRQQCAELLVRDYDERFPLDMISHRIDEVRQFITTAGQLPQIRARMQGHGRICFDLTQDESAESISIDHANRLAQVERRRGQPAFRRNLLQAYGNRCAVTGCDVEALLEAAHIIPHCQGSNYAPSNGLLLRADIHTLYDLDLLAITATGEIELDATVLTDQTYRALAGRSLRFPDATADTLAALQRNLQQRHQARRINDGAARASDVASPAVL